MVLTVDVDLVGRNYALLFKALVFPENRVELRV